jgi:hypothetical protein
MKKNNLTSRKIIGKLERKERLTYQEEFFYLVEVLNFSEEKAEEILMENPEARKLKMHSAVFATAA